MILDEIKSLPETVSKKELQTYFNELLNHSNMNISRPLDISEALYLLADKQWHTYERLELQTKARIDNWIQKNWDTTSIVLVENLISVIAYLGLDESFKLLLDSLNHEMKDEVRIIILDAINELKDNIQDPYSGM